MSKTKSKASNPAPATATRSKPRTKAKAGKNLSNSKKASSKSESKTKSKASARAKSAGSRKSAPATKSAAAITSQATRRSTDKLPAFLGLSAKYTQAAGARVHILPVPYEETTTYGKGTADGPRALLEASQEVELFDDELWTESYKIGIHTSDAIVMDKVEANTAKPFQALYEAVKPLVETDRFPLIIGGEHSITLGAIRAFAERYKDLSILQIDAHCDLRPSYDGNPYSHASVGYRLYETLQKPMITQVGIRNVSKQEAHWMETERPKINIFWARMQDKWNFQEIVNTLSNNVYITIDVDALDSSVMPSTGTPEPGGISWYQLMELIKNVCVRKNVVGADIVELAPIPGLHAPDFLAAKLAYKLIGYRFALDLGVTKKYV